MSAEWGGDLSLPPLAMLQRRATLLADIRAFFSGEAVLEVETPLMGPAPASDLALSPLITRYEGPGGNQDYFLQSSPEYAMKRLLCAGSGSIYQLSKAFRNGESGRFHSPEFTLLEWYRTGFDYRALMDEVSDFLVQTAGMPVARLISYQHAFESAVGVEPHAASAACLLEAAKDLGLDVPVSVESDRDALLDFLLTQRVESSLPTGVPVLLFDYPVSQAALAKIRPGDPPVAERFELYFNGIELANGYSELTDAAEYRRRFEADNVRRLAAGVVQVPLDEALLTALETGLPTCAGVALGVDRLLMAMSGAGSLTEVAMLTCSLSRGGRIG
ncbi:MAG: EF-P lysine aminoacylase GenX [Gammaproteobacteria bacterium]|nr:EF-P lysine aminoacylase GenX [Gammaproteobacteria bacterium]